MAHFESRPPYDAPSIHDLDKWWPGQRIMDYRTTFATVSAQTLTPEENLEDWRGMRSCQCHIEQRLIAGLKGCWLKSLLRAITNFGFLRLLIRIDHAISGWCSLSIRIFLRILRLRRTHLWIFWCSGHHVDLARDCYDIGRGRDLRMGWKLGRRGCPIFDLLPEISLCLTKLPCWWMKGADWGSNEGSFMWV